MQDEAEMLRKQIQELNTSIRYAAESIEHITSHRKNGPYAMLLTVTYYVNLLLKIMLNIYLGNYIVWRGFF